MYIGRLRRLFHTYDVVSGRLSRLLTLLNVSLTARTRHLGEVDLAVWLNPRLPWSTRDRHWALIRVQETGDISVLLHSSSHSTTLVNKTFDLKIIITTAY